MGPRSVSRSKFFKRLKLGNGIDVEFLGNWDNVMNYLKTLPMDVMMAAQQAQATVAKNFAKEVKETILRGNVEGPPKRYSSKDSRLLINTRTYVDSIRAYKKGKVWYVGVEPGYKDKKGKIELRFLAEIHEFGKRLPKGYIPPRPVWFPTYQRLGGIWATRRPIWDRMKKSVNRHKPREVKITYGKLF